MRYTLFAILLIYCTTLAWSADGECRLFFAGNLSIASEAQRQHLSAQLVALQAQSKADGVPSLLLLPGNLCSTDKETPQHNAATLALVASLSPAAIALGPNELQHGMDYLRVRQPAVPLPWVSTSVVPRELPVALSRTVSAGTLHIGIIGLTLAPGEMPDKALRNIVTRQVAALRLRCDLVVLLGNFDALQAPILPALYPGTDLIIGAATDTAPQAPAQTVFAPGDPQVPYFGQLDLAIRDGRLAAWRGWMKPQP